MNGEYESVVIADSIGGAWLPNNQIQKTGARVGIWASILARF